MTDETKLTDAEREELSRLFGYVPEPEPLEQMLAAVERILAERTQALRDEVEQLREERDYHHARFDVLRAKLGGTVSLRGVPAGSYWADWHRTHCAAAEAATRAEAQLAKVRELANAWDEIPDYQPTTYDDGRCDQRHMMIEELLLALGSES